MHVIFEIARKFTKKFAVRFKTTFRYFIKRRCENRTRPAWSVLRGRDLYFKCCDISISVPDRCLTLPNCWFFKLIANGSIIQQLLNRPPWQTQLFKNLFLDWNRHSKSFKKCRARSGDLERVKKLNIRNICFWMTDHHHISSKQYRENGEYIFCFPTKKYNILFFHLKIPTETLL